MEKYKNILIAFAMLMFTITKNIIQSFGIYSFFFIKRKLKLLFSESNILLLRNASGLVIARF
jgi:hypothetical protein